VVSLIKINSYIDNKNLVKYGLVDSRLGAFSSDELDGTKRRKRISDSANTKLSAISCLLQVFIIFFQNKIHVPLFICRNAVSAKQKQNKSKQKTKQKSYQI